MSRKVCLVVIDGWGKSPESHGNAIKNANVPVMDKLESEKNIYLEASEENVGVPLGQMGNSEVGHLNIGAGRIVYQDIVRINQAIRNDQLVKNQELINICKNSIDNSNSRIHLAGLISDGGVHSHINHLFGLMDACKRLGVKECYIHFFSDGRDTSPTSSVDYIRQVYDKIDQLGDYGKLTTIVGRYYAMDRDFKWDRIKVAYDAMISGVGTHVTKDKVIQYIQECYKKDETDEFLKPIILNDQGQIKDNDSLILIDFRSDRMRLIATALGIEQKFEPIKVAKNLKITCMTQYNAEFNKYFPVLFDPVSFKNVLAEWLSVKKVPQFHVAETEKYAHVTFFFNGGVEKQFEGEDRELVPSPKHVPTYDLAPEMSASLVGDAVVRALEKNKYGFVMCNFAPPDMVGHTGKYEPTIIACETTDTAIGKIREACEKHNYVLCVTSDHGNAEKMYAEGDKPHTAHTMYPVPFCNNANLEFAAPKDRLPALCDVAPTILDIMGLEIPSEMSGKSLLVR